MGTQKLSERSLIWILACLPLFVILLLGGGAIDAPMNDEFSYARFADSFATTGGFKLNGWGTPLMLPQLFLGATLIKLLGFKYLTLHWVGLCATLPASAFLYRFLRAVQPSRSLALTLWSGIIFSSVVLSSAPSFLTDVPTMALCLMAWTLFAEGMLKPGEITSADRVKLGTGCLFAFLAALNRQNTILPFAVGMIAIAAFQPRSRSIIIPSVLLTTATGLTLVSYFSAMPFAVPVNPIAGFLVVIGWPDITIKFMVKFGITIGLMVLPAALLGLRTRNVSLLTLIVVATWICVFIWIPMTTQQVELFSPVFRLTLYGQYLTSLGVAVGGVHGFGSRLDVFPGLGYLWSALGMIGTVLSTGLILSESKRCWDGIRKKERLSTHQQLGVALLLFVVVQLFTMIPWLAMNNMFDRYLLLLVPFITAVHILSGGPLKRFLWAKFVAIAAVCCSIIWGIVTSHEYFGYSKARMTLYQAAQAQKIAKENIDGGVEYNGDLQIVVEGHVNNRQMEPSSLFDETRHGINVDYEAEKFPVVLATHRLSTSSMLDWADSDALTQVEWISMFPPFKRIMGLYHIGRKE